MLSSPARRMALAAAFAASAVATATVSGPAAAAPARRATLEVRLSGLPQGQPAGATLRGPGLSRELRSARMMLRGVRPGRYVLTLRRVTFTRARNGIAKGSIALPSRRRVAVGVKAGGRARLSGGWGMVMRAGVERAPRRVTDVLGAPEDPTGIVVPRGGIRYRAGGYVTSGPTATFPHGLISRITRVRTRGARVTLGLRSVPVTEVVPEFRGWAASDSGAARAAADTVGPEPRVGGLRFLKSVPCRVDSDATRSAGPSFDLGLRDPRLEQLEWSVLSPRVHIRTSGEWFARFALNPGDALKCSETLAGFTQFVPIPVGPIVVPFFFGAKIVARAAMTQTGERASVDHAVALTLDADTARGSADWLQRTTTPRTVVDGRVALDMQASGGFFVEAGVGAPKIANVRLEMGPELVLEAPASGTCQAQARLSAKLIAELLIRQFTLDVGSQTIIGPMALPWCRSVDPILGDWRYRDGGGELRITQAGGGFEATALTNVTIDDSACVYQPAGTRFQIAGADGSYTTPYVWWRVPDCTEADRDPAATMKILPFDRDQIDFCGSTARSSGCDTLDRIRR